MRRAIFLDRDGVICQNRTDHVKNWSEFDFLPGAKNSLAALSRVGLPIIVVTNQAAVGRGLLTTETLDDIHQHMVAEVTAYGGRIDRIFYCPHLPQEGCHCRKPQPGMLLQAAQEMDLDLAGSYMLGDAASDIQAGQQVGCHTILVLTGRGQEQLIPALHSSGGHFLTISRNLEEAVAYIMGSEAAAEKLQPVDSPHYHQPLLDMRL